MTRPPQASRPAPRPGAAAPPTFLLLLALATGAAGSGGGDGPDLGGGASTVSGAGRASGRPLAVSPGHPTRFLPIADRCPTFSWGQVAGAGRYELVVYRIGEEGTEPPVALRAKIDGRAGSWTPTLGGCLERGGRYAWSVRARGAGRGGGWSAPALFEVAAGPGEAELEEALALLLERAAAPGLAGRLAAAPDRIAAATGGRSAGDRGEASGKAAGGPRRARASSGRAAAGTAAGAAEAEELSLSVEGRIEAGSFAGDGAALTEVVAAGLGCAGCVGAAELADGAVTTAKIGAGCAPGELLLRGAAGWECATLTAPACAPGDQLGCYTGPAATLGVGECRSGLRICAADSSWGACAGEVLPAAAELCDGLDNTCDGPIDEGDPATLCPPTANVTATECAAAGCAITACAESWADADGAYANGCEAPADGSCLEGGAPRAVAGPAAGQLVIRELLADPAAPLTDASGEWFEVVAKAAVDLNGLGLGTAFGTVIDELAAPGCLRVEAGEVLLFARSADPAANGGLTPDHLFGFSLVNGGGELHLAWGGELVDAVSWSGAAVEPGRARNLPPLAEDATANDDPASWCTLEADPALLYSEGNHGTPAAANVACP